MTLIKVNNYYTSEDGRYVVKHEVGYANVNYGKISRKQKKDKWVLTDRQNHNHISFNSLKLAEHYVLTGEYRAFL